MIAQVHSHPAEAYLSTADEESSVVTKYGTLSIIVPDFGYSDLHFQNSAVYRLFPETGWKKLSKKQINSLIKIVE